MKKTCSKCGIAKPTDKFTVDNTSKDNRHSNCKLCKSISAKNREHSLGRRFSNYKYRAKIDGLGFKLTSEDFRNLTNKSCAYCGGFSVSTSNKFTGIDRINSKKGYVKSNIVPCCNICNMMKGALDYDEFTKHIEKMFGYLSDME